MVEHTERCEKLAIYLIENNATVRQTAKEFGISKSTVHKDITEKLSKINHKLYVKVLNVLKINKQERHLRGGEATRKKYKNKKVL
jgi:putative DeoR family transcriptional regulator (stage III sporulation protein D)